MAARSKKEPRFSAEMTPMETPTITQMIAAPIASDSVTGKRFWISGRTGWLVRKE